MTLLTEKGTFTKTTSTSTPVSQQVTLVNSSLTPKIIILWTNGLTTSNGTYAEDALCSYGWSDTANDVCQSTTWSEANQGEAYALRNDAIINLFSTSLTEVSKADISAVAAGSFTLNWSVQSDTSAMVIHYIVIGGTDITNVSAFTGTSVNTGTGNKSWNGTGTTFTPDFALMMNSPDATMAVNTFYAAQSRSRPCIGAALSTSKKWAFSFRGDTAATSGHRNTIQSTSCLNGQQTGSGGLNYSATFVSFDNAAGGGITLNVTDGSSTANGVAIGFLLVKGGKWDCNVFQQRSGTGTQDVLQTDSTVVPKVVSLFGVGTNSTSILPVPQHAYVCIGGSDGTREGNSWNGGKDAVNPWQTGRSNDTGKVFRNAATVATASSITTAAECDLIAMSTGQFTLDWTTADTTQRWMSYWSVGEVSTTTTVTATSIQKYNIAAAVTTVSQTSIQKYALRQNVAATASIHKYNLRMYLTQTIIHKYRLGGIVLQTFIAKYTIRKNLAQTIINKYNILRTVTATTSIHKYRLRHNIAQTIIHKYSMRQMIPQTSIHRYHVLSLFGPVPMTIQATKNFLGRFLAKL